MFFSWFTTMANDASCGETGVRSRRGGFRLGGWRRNLGAKAWCVAAHHSAHNGGSLDLTTGRASKCVRTHCAQAADDIQNRLWRHRHIADALLPPPPSLFPPLLPTGVLVTPET